MAQQTEFIPYEQAIELKQLGFDVPCYKYVYVGDKSNAVKNYIDVEPSKAKNYNNDFLCISQPTFSQAFRWFRDKKLADASVCRHGKADGSYSYRWDIVYEYGVYEERHFKMDYNTYEEAELACLKKLIEIVKNK